MILEYTTMSSAQYFAALCIKGIFASSWNKIESKTKVEFKLYLMNYLASKAATTSIDSLKAIIQCLILIVKLAWFDDPTFKDIVSEFQTFGTFSYNHQLVTFIAYDLFIQEMCYFNKSKVLDITHTSPKLDPEPPDCHEFPRRRARRNSHVLAQILGHRIFAARFYSCWPANSAARTIAPRAESN